MKDYNEEYFFVESNGNERIPSLMLDDEDSHYSLKMLWAEPLEYTNPLRLKFNHPPRKPVMADFHNMSAPVISEKLKNVFELLELKYIQLVPALIRDKSDDIIEGYHILKVFNPIACMDMEKSEYDKFDDGQIMSLDKLILDNQTLDKIPLNNRLIFNLGESKTDVLYHVSVVEKILETAPTGLVVYRLDKWDSGLPFREEYAAYLRGESEE